MDVPDLQVEKLISKLDVRKAEATKPADKEMIQRKVNMLRGGDSFLPERGRLLLVVAPPRLQLACSRMLLRRPY